MPGVVEVSLLEPFTPQVALRFDAPADGVGGSVAEQLRALGAAPTRAYLAFHRSVEPVANSP